MPNDNGWTRDQLIVALKLYCELPFGKMHSRNPAIIRYAELIDRTPSALAMKLTNLASLDPEIRSTGRKGLSGASKADRDIWAEMTSNWDHLAAEIALVDAALGVSPLSGVEVESIDNKSNYEGVTRTAVIEVRIGQGFFRKAVLSSYESKCCITGTGISELLIASHIIPWKSDPANRLNPRNGLCLSAIHDRAFDLGLIAISDSFELMVCDRLRKAEKASYIGQSFLGYEGKMIRLPEKFSPEPAFLSYHRENIFSR